MGSREETDGFFDCFRTPCTVRAGFVSAVLKAGYHVELAGGGHYNAKALRDKVDEIQKLVGLPGVGITLNSLYINQRQWFVLFLSTID